MNRALIERTLAAMDKGYMGHNHAEYAAVMAALRQELEKQSKPYAWVFVPHNELLWPDEVEHKTPCKATGYIPLYKEGTTNV